MSLFQEGRHGVFLLSSNVAAEGLNLTAASKVVLFDPSWNPIKDAQAQSRVHRIGQLRDVEVYRLVATGAVDELICT